MEELAAKYGVQAPKLTRSQDRFVGGLRFRVQGLGFEHVW